MNATARPTTITAVPDSSVIEIVREFDASPADVFRAFVEPDLVVQWLGPYDRSMEIQRWDVRTGGGYAYLHRGPDGTAVGFRGVFHTVRAAEVIVQTFEFDGAPDEVALHTMRFLDLGDGRTRLVGRSAFASTETRDVVLASGMDRGVQQSHERLDTLLAD